MRELARLLGVGFWSSRPAADGTATRIEGSYLHLDADPREGLPALLEAVHPEDRDALAAAAEQAARDNACLAMSFRSAHAATRFLRIAASVRRQAGMLVLAEGYLVDDTAQVVAQARLATIADTTPALLWLMEPDGFCSFFSRSWYDYTGQTPEEALGMGWLQKVHPADIGMAAECATRAVELKTHFRIEHRLRHRDGGWRWVLCVGNPRFGADGRFLGHSGAVTDIHERRVWEHRMRAKDGSTPSGNPE